jgi:SAM-dependent methyltransferase
MDKNWREYLAQWEGEHWFARAVEHTEFYSSFYRRLRRHLPPGSTVLDIGSGNGYSAFWFASLGYGVTGIDTDRPAVEEAGEWARRLGLPVRFIEGDAFSFLPEERYSLSYSMGLIEHFPAEERVRLLGRQADFSELVVALAPTRHSRRTLPPCSVPWTNETVRSLRRTFRDAGLEVIESFGVGDVYSRWDARVKELLPRYLLRKLQDRFSYAMSVAVIGRRPATTTP